MLTYTHSHSIHMAIQAPKTECSKQIKMRYKHDTKLPRLHPQKGKLTECTELTYVLMCGLV